MPMMNRVTDLLNLAEDRLGTDELHLPDRLSKDVWAHRVLNKTTLNTFSRYLPYGIPYFLTPDRKKYDYYLIDEKLCESQVILGCGDIDWKQLSKSNPGWGYGSASYYSMFDQFNNGLTLDDVAGYQMLLDHTSLFKVVCYPVFKPPNMIKLESALSNNIFDMYKSIPIMLFVKHSENLMTIPPTQMEMLEELFCCDVATFLYNRLKYYNQVDTTYANIDLQLDVLQDYMARRPDSIAILKDASVTAANRYQPIMITI